MITTEHPSLSDVLPGSAGLLDPTDEAERDLLGGDEHRRDVTLIRCNEPVRRCLATRLRSGSWTGRKVLLAYAKSDDAAAYIAYRNRRASDPESLKPSWYGSTTTLMKACDVARSKGLFGVWVIRERIGPVGAGQVTGRVYPAA